MADALVYASNAGSGNISFSSTVFNAANTAAQNTILLQQNQATHFLPEPFEIPANTTITGPTTVVNGATINLVTIKRPFETYGYPESAVIQVNSVSGATISNLNLTGGVGGIFNDYGSMTVNHCLITQNISSGSGGGILNYGTMTVKTSSIIGNQSVASYGQDDQVDAGLGGGVANTGSLTIIDSTISGNFAGNENANGGGISNSGTLTVINSTITGNSSESSWPSDEAGPINAVITGNGGGIFNSSTGTLTLINSTITGNTMTVYIQTGLTAGPGSGGGGISGVATLENTIVAGNTASVGNNDYQGNYTDDGGNLVGVTEIGLAPLAYYGGPTQTMIPLPGSPAICYGTLANVAAAALAIDQRGFPRTTHYSGVPVTCADAGAVQTNYALSFTTQPPATAVVNEPMTPAPVVGLAESGSPVTYSNAEVALADTHHVLVAPTLAQLINGSATFSNAVMTAAATNDAVYATLGLASTPELPTLNLVANASVKVTAPAVPAMLLSPAPGSALGATNIHFTWSAGISENQYQLWLGFNGPGSSDLFNSGLVTAFSATVPSLPTTGATVYARLFSKTGNLWSQNDYTFTEGVSVAATLTSPTPGSGLGAANIRFTWSPGTYENQYQLWLGLNGPGSSDLYSSGLTTALSTTVPSLPAHGSTVYARLFSKIGNSWSQNDYTFTEP